MWFFLKNLNEEYKPSSLAKFIHGWPHISYKTFKPRGSEFQPDNSEYVETLLFWAGVPIVWLGVCIVILLLFSCCLCVKRNQPPGVRTGIARLRWWLIAFVLLSIAAIGVSFYGNSLASNGIHIYINAVGQLNNTMSEIDTNIHVVNFDTGAIPSTAHDLYNTLPACTSNGTVRNVLQQLVSDINESVNNIETDTSSIQAKLDGTLISSLYDTSETIQQYQLWGWIILIGFFSLDLILCSSMILCTGKTHRGGIILCCIVLIIAFTMVWVAAAGEMFIAVGLSDLCVAPNQYLITEGTIHNVDQDVLKYYTDCTSAESNPFQKEFTDSSNAAFKAMSDLDKIASVCGTSPTVMEDVNQLREQMDDVKNGLSTLQISVDCKAIHKDYNTALCSLCINGLSGVGVLLAFGVVIGILWLVVICQGTLLASRLSRRKMNYDADQEDPFLPPRDGAATLERYSARRDQQLPSTSGLGCRPTSSTSQGGSAGLTQSGITVPDDLPPSYTLAISRDRPNQRRINHDESPDNRYSAASLV